MKRREFITLLGGAAASWPLVARSQQTDRVRRIGVLSSLARDDQDNNVRIAAAAAIPLQPGSALRFLTGFKYAPERLSKVQSVGRRCVWNAVSAFANCGRAVANVRAANVPPVYRTDLSAKK